MQQPDLYYPGLETKSLTGAVDDVTDQGLVVARASVFGTPDSPPVPGARVDVVHDTAFDATLAERKAAGRIAHLYNHNWGAVLGSHVDIWPEPGRGLLAKSQHNLNGFWGNEIFQLVKGGDITAYSFAFLPRRNTAEQKSWEIDAEGRRHLYAVDLFELGPTPNAIAIHPDARVVEAKSGLFLDTSFAGLLTQADNVWSQVVAEAEALAARREARGPHEGRKSLSADVIESLELQADRLQDYVTRLRALAAVPEGTQLEATPNRSAEFKSLLKRHELARARLRQLGVPVE